MAAVFLAASKLLDLAFAPLSWALALLVAAVLLRRRRHAWALVVAAIAVLAAFSSGPVANAIARAAERSAPRTFRPDARYDAVIVLGGAYDPAASRRSGEVELRESAERILRGWELVRDGRAAHVLVSGGAIAPAPGEQAEADAVAGLYRAWGVPADRIVAEPRSRNTRENAIESARIVRERGWRSLLLVTSAAHMPRALGCFHAVGLAPDALPVDRRAGDGGERLPRADALALATDMLRELAGRVVYRAAGYARSAPP
jgi:uncharacterized SAM-binding protein YcdF (DUF218 family)